MGMHAPLIRRSVGAVPSRSCKFGARRGFVSDNLEALTPSASSTRGRHAHAHSKNASEVTGHEFYQGVPPSSEYQHAAASQPRGSFLGSWMFSMAIVGLTAIGALCSAATCFVLYIRPLLKSMEETCKATTEAAEKLEAASEELEKAAVMFQEELPPATQAVDDASREFVELGETLNALSGGLSGFRPNMRGRKRQRGKEEADQNMEGGKDIVVKKPGTESRLQPENMDADMRVLDTINATTEGIQRQTMDGISKVAADINSLARTLTPAMDMWQRRLAGMVTRVEVEAKEIDETDNKKARTTKGNPDRQSANAWISNWRQKTSEEETGQLSAAPPLPDTEKTVDFEGDNRAVEEALDGVCVEIGRASESNASSNEDTIPPEAFSQVTHDLDDIFEKIIVPQSKRSESAIAVIEALYKAEQAAENAAQASGNLQAAVKRAQISGAFEGIPGIMDADGKASFLQSNGTENGGEDEPVAKNVEAGDSDKGGERKEGASRLDSEVPVQGNKS
ncbi:hypothetical protein BSKO_01348 [Bryopsis sp. KO-2023]|nr:hypothetical protein BSKO_01348 [Bryopsis sp. KO-2023]